MENLLRIESISHFNQLMGIPAPEHPLITVYEQEKREGLPAEYQNIRFTTEMYAILFKDNISGSLRYGRNAYDFQHGTLLFVSPGQVIEFNEEDDYDQNQGWVLVFHPDLIRKSTLGANIDEYTFFSYDVHEALHLSQKEQDFINEVVIQIKQEYSQNIDKHSQRLIISNLELLLNYCTRFYDRQFYTRTNFNKDFVSQFEHTLKAYFNSEKPIEMGIPSVSYFGREMNMSASYLSDLLKKETGKSIKSHINDFIIDKAKTTLLNSEDAVSEIAYQLGFEYPQSFTRLFKSKMGLSPLEYRTMN